MPSSPSERRRWGRTHATIVFLFVAAASACGGVDDAPPSAGPGEGIGGGGTARCPDAEPTAGDACASVLKSCMYGDSVRPDCRRVWSCDGGAWKAPDATCPQPVACPSVEPVQRSACAHVNDECSFGDLLCQCFGCDDPGCGIPPTWECGGPPGGGCPDRVPNLGSPCGDEGLHCTYYGGSPCSLILQSDGVDVTCKHGVWDWDFKGCL